MVYQTCELSRRRARERGGDQKKKGESGRNEVSIGQFLLKQTFIPLQEANLRKTHSTCYTHTPGLSYV